MFRFDPESPELQENPYPAYRELRDNRPAYVHPDRQFWALSRWDDVADALKHTAIFSSRRTLEEPDPMLAFMPMIVVMDPPRHDLLRALVSRAFTPRRISDLEPRIRAVATHLIDEFIESGSCDLFCDLTAQLPIIVIAELPGIPSQDRAMFKEQSTMLASSVNPGEENHGTDASTELHDYLAKAFAEKRKDRGMIS